MTLRAIYSVPNAYECRDYGCYQWTQHLSGWCEVHRRTGEVTDAALRVMQPVSCVKCRAVNRAQDLDDHVRNEHGLDIGALTIPVKLGEYIRNANARLNKMGIPK